MDFETNHLYFNGSHYDAQHQLTAGDIPFWTAQAKKYSGSLLELGCGTGRLAIPLTQSGITVTGIDFSDSMLTQAQRNAASEGLSIKLVKADMRDFNLGERFNLIILPVNTLCHMLSIQDFGNMLNSVKKHAHAGTCFIIDIFNPQLTTLLRNPDEEFEFAEYPHPNGQGSVIVTATGSYNRSTQISTLSLRYQMDGDSIQDELKMRIYLPQELEGLLCFNGFTIEAKYGDYDQSPFQSDSPRQIIVARLGGA